MNRLDRFRFGNLHKRRILVVISVIVLMALTSVLFLTFIGFFGSRAELPRLRATAELTSGSTRGVGINVLDIPDANIIDDPFFSKNDICINSSVSEASGYNVFFDPEQASVLSDVSEGSTVNILSIDGNGKMGLRYSGNVLGFTDTTFGVPVQLEDQSALWLNDPVVKTAAVSGSLYLLTESGRLISDASVFPTEVTVDVPFADICAEDISVYALTCTGDVYISTDAGSFTLLDTCGLSEGVVPEYISCANGNINIFLSDDSVMTYSSAGFVRTGTFDYDIVVSGDGFMAVSFGDDVYISRNGLFMVKVEQIDEIIRENDAIIDMEAGDNALYVLSEYGKLVRIDMSDDAPEITSRDISSLEPLSICPSGDNAVIAVTSDHQSSYISMAGDAFKSLGLSGITADDVMMFGDDSYIVRSGNALYETSLMSAIEVDLPIAEGAVMEGDICMIKNSGTDTKPWNLYGQTELISQEDGVCLAGSGDGLHAMSNPLGGPSSELFEENLFYRIEVTMSSNVPDTRISVWLEGDVFGSQGFSIDDVSDQPRSYSYVFVVTEQMLSDENIRFNISFDGEAMVDIHNVYVGLDRYDINSVPSGFTEDIIGSNPAALRFASIIPGSDGFCEETFYGVSASSLERAMILSKDSGADPWIVMGSSISQTDVDDLLGYMCGSVSDEHGRNRIDNGTALPWSRQFDTIYIEICDSDGAFQADSQRGAYVSYVIGLFAKSEFYLEIKDKVVFIDGMDYEGGVMLSDADRHASGIVLDVTDNNGEEVGFIESVYSSIDNMIYEAPRSRNSGAGGGEFVSSVRIGSSFSSVGYDAADIVSAIIRAESKYSELIMIDSDMPSCGLIATLRPLMNGDLMYCETMAPLDTTSRFTAESFDSSCETLLIDKADSICLIIANHSDELQQFVVFSDAYNTADGFYRRYSSQGSLLMERDLDRLGLRLVLQAGEYMVIEIPK